MLLLTALMVGSFSNLQAGDDPPRLHPSVLQLAQEQPNEKIKIIVQRMTQEKIPAQALQRAGGKIGKELPIINGFAMEIPARAVEALARTPGVRWISLDAPVISTTCRNPVGLAAAYSFEDGSGSTVTDTSGNGNSATINGASWSNYGKYGKAMSFDGYNDWVNVANATVFERPDGITLSAWVYPTNTNTWRTVISKYEPSVKMWGLWASNGYGRPTVELHTPNGYWSDATSSPGLPTNSWSHLATTYDGTTLKLYINGQLVDSEARSGGFTNWPEGFSIGKNNIWGEYFAGRLDEVRIYHRVLKQNELQVDMNTPLCTPGTTTENVQLIPQGATWRYLDNGSNQGTAWQGLDFNDSGWATGNAEFGYGDGEEATVVSYGPNANNKYVTTYFRHTFQVLNPKSFSQLTLQLQRDDGAIVYLNGKEVGRSNMPNGSVSYNTYASSSISGSDESTYFSFSPNEKWLKHGDNVLAVEIHQATADSSDSSFDLTLSGQSTCADCVDTANLANSYIPATNADLLWRNASPLDGRNITVAVVDSGIASHGDLHGSGQGNSRIIASVDVSTDVTGIDGNGHGTHVAGIIGGNGKTSVGARIGIAPKVNLVDVKVGDSNGVSLVSDVVEGLQWIYDNKDLYNIRVVNLSMNSSVPEPYNLSPLSAATEILWFNGVVVVVAAGNNGTGSAPVTLLPPANDPFVITVGAVDDAGTSLLSDDTVATFSAYGTTQDGFAKPDLVAPGRNIISLLAGTNARLYLDHPSHRVDQDLFRMSGTSMATPMVAGAVALLLQDEPNLTPDQVKYRLKATANTNWSGYEAAKAGAGYLDINATVNGTTTANANTGIAASQTLWTGEDPIAWDSVSWNSVSWNSVSWNSVSWNSVSWNSVSWNSVTWNSAVWDDEIIGASAVQPTTEVEAHPPTDGRTMGQAQNKESTNRIFVPLVIR